MEEIWFTTSWDDGHPLDLRLADLLDRHGFCGTFYVPGANREGRPVLSSTDLRFLASRHEIGGHTLDHCYLNRVGWQEARRQIVEGKKILEERIGDSVSGFSYPGGKHTPVIREMVKEAGFRYARTVENFRTDLPSDPYRLGTTAQFYPHGRLTLFRNFIRSGEWKRKWSVFRQIAVNADWIERMQVLLEGVSHFGGVFHLWGHSWEIDQLEAWEALERFLAFAAERVPPGRRVENRAIPFPGAFPL